MSEHGDNVIPPDSNPETPPSETPSNPSLSPQSESQPSTILQPSQPQSTPTPTTLRSSSTSVPKPPPEEEVEEDKPKKKLAKKSSTDSPEQEKGFDIEGLVKQLFNLLFKTPKNVKGIFGTATWLLLQPVRLVAKVGALAGKPGFLDKVNGALNVTYEAMGVSFRHPRKDSSEEKPTQEASQRTANKPEGDGQQTPSPGNQDPLAARLGNATGELANQQNTTATNPTGNAPTTPIETTRPMETSDRNSRNTVSSPTPIQPTPTSSPAPSTPRSPSALPTIPSSHDRPEPP